MAVVLTLSDVLDLQDVDKIPVGIKEKIENVLSSRSEEVISWKSKYEKLRVNSEQQYFDIEKQLITCNGKLEIEITQKNSFKEKLDALESKHAEAARKLKDLQESKDSLQKLEHEFKSSIQLLENEKRDLSIIANKRSKEIDRLNEEIDQLAKKLTAANNEKCEAQAKLSEIQSQEISREFREKRLEKEKEQLQSQVDWLNAQLTEKTNQLSHVRKEKTTHVLDIQSQLDEKTQEVIHLQSVVDSLKESSEEQTKRIETLIQKLKEERDGQVQIEEQFRQELAVQKRLIQLYKVSSEESEAKITELTGAVDELRNLLKEASTVYTDLERSKEEEIHKWESSCREKDETVSKLRQELKNANELLVALKKGSMTLSDDAVESLSPSAAATSKLLKSGMSLTQIYNEYVQAVDALNEEREENKRLNSYLEQILQEIEEKAPLLKKQREDYESALVSLDQMTSQLDSTMLECEKLRTEAEDVHRRYGLIQRECVKYQQTAQDLSRQVNTLLKEVEELRGGRVVRDDLNVSSTEVSSSSNIISEKLVTFRSIEELQKQNQRLLEVCRELSEQKEKEENEATNEKVQELKEQLDVVQTELDILKDARARQVELVESIVRQRDMYRILLHQGGSSPELQMSAIAPVTSTPLPAAVKVTSTTQDKVSLEAAKKELRDTQNALKELQAEFDVYKKDKAENDKLQNETVDKLQTNLSEMRLANSKLSTQLEYATERYKIVQNNAAGFKKEIDLLQERNHKSSATILKLESAVAHLKEELMGAQENVARWQVQVENLKAEKELVRNSEKRLSMELESIRREQMSQSMLMASLQAIQNNQERAEFETVVRHKNQVEGLEREMASLRRRLETLLEEKTQQATAWEDIVKTVHLELQHEKDKQASLQSKYDNTLLELETAKQELTACESKLAAAESRLEKLSTQTSREEDSTLVESRVDSEAIKDLKHQMAQQQILIKNLRQQVEAAKKHANQYKTIADSVEQNLKEQTMASKEVQEACQKKVQEAGIEKETILKRLELLEKDFEAALAENVRLSTESNSLHGDLRKQLASLRNELEEAVSQRNGALAKCEAAQEDCRKQAEIASQAQDKYQRELMLHAADVEALSAVRKQMEDMQEHLQQSQEETILFEKQLLDAKTSWVEQERIYKEEVKMLDERCQELTKQNSNLHDQMAKLSAQVIDIQQSSQQQAGATLRSVGPEQGKTSEQLLEVIRFLRREKEIAETKLQVVETECSRIKHRYTHLEKQFEETSKSLAEERQRSQVNSEIVVNQVELMRKVSHLNVLTDSNKLLRDERDQLLNSKQELEAKVRKLEAEIEPLQKSLRELESQKETLTIERDTLQEEVNRWKNRTSNLIEQSHKTDPEEHKRLIQEKENIRKQLIQVKEENFKLRAELNRVNNTLASVQTELNNLKQEMTKTSQERDIMKKEVEDKTKESEEKTSTINSLKQIGRKYKKMAEDVNKELEDLKAKAAIQESDKTIAELRRSVSTHNESLTSLQNQLVESQSEAQAALKRAEQAQIENQSLRDSLRTKEQELSESDARGSKLKGDMEDFERKAVEFEKKLAQSRQVLQNARSKIMIQKAQMEKLELENKELKDFKDSMSAGQSSMISGDSDQVQSLKAHYEAKVSDLEKELRELRAAATRAAASSQAALDLERLQQEIAELQAKNQHLQRQLEAAQHKAPLPQQPVSARPASSVGPSTTMTDAPKTANIKPMATAPSSRHTVPISSHSPAAAKATASIRPMAISPTAASLPVTGTPTATVMPTTVSQHDSTEDNMPGPSGLQQSSSSSLPAVSVSGRVQIVEPQLAVERNHESADTTDLTEESVSNQAIVNPSVQETMTQVVNPTVALSSSSVGAGPSLETVLQQQQHTTGFTLGKRVRDDDSLPATEESDSKRTRISGQEHTIPTITVTDENQQLVTQIPPQSSTTSLSQSHQLPPSQGKPSVITLATVVPATSLSACVQPVVSSSISWQIESSKDHSEPMSVGHQEETVSTSQVGERRQQTDDVIMVLSDEDDQAGVDEGERLNDGGDEEEDYEDDDEEDDEEDDDIEETEDGDDVVIIDMDEAQPVTQVPSLPRPPPPLQPIAHAERLPSVGRSQQLTPFLLAGQGAMFDEDDCTVPSTPTLSQPRRADGFAEALNSPAVPQQFVFGSEGGNNPDLGELESQRGLGMDDTKMDLSQFDVAGARSVPTTPTLQTATSDSRSQETGDRLAEEVLEGAGGEEEAEQTAQESLRQEVENEEQEDALLEGDGELEAYPSETNSNNNATDTTDQQTAEASSPAGSSQDESQSCSDRSENIAKPPIKKIVWDASESPSSSSSAPTASVAAIATVMGGVATSTPIVQQQSPRRAQGLRRGGPTRGRGTGAQFWPPGSQSRGVPFSGPRGRGGRGFRGY